MTEKFNSISQKDYDEIIKRVNIFALGCPCCGNTGNLRIHAYYSRSVFRGSEKITLTITRVICRSCGRTHALLPAWLVPYSRISLDDHVYIIAEGFSRESAARIQLRLPSVTESGILRILRTYRNHWKERLAASRCGFKDIPALIRKCLSDYHKQFMQIKCTPNILFLRTT